MNNDGCLHLVLKRRLSALLIGLLVLPFGATVLAEEADPRIKGIMGIVTDKPKADPRIFNPLDILEDQPEAMDFTLNDFDGGSLTLSEQRGKRVFVHFWSVYCPHCAREVSTLEQMYELYYEMKKKGLTKETKFLAVNFGEDKDKIVQWAEAHNVSLEPDPEGDVIILLDSDKSVTKGWKVRGLPSTFLLDKEGRIVAQAIGERDWTQPAILNQLGLLPGLGQLPE